MSFKGRTECCPFALYCLISTILSFLHHFMEKWATQPIDKKHLFLQNLCILLRESLMLFKCICLLLLVFKFYFLPNPAWLSCVSRLLCDLHPEAKNIKEEAEYVHSLFF